MTARQCYFIPVGQFDEVGYIPSVVTQGEPGHAPLTGTGTFASPWHWGKTYEEAVVACAGANRSLGLSEDDVLQIVASSMFHQEVG